MDSHALPSRLFEAASHHLNMEANWLPLVGLCVAAAVGLVFLLRGARLAPVLAAAAFGLVGAGIGRVLTDFTGLTPWVTISLSSVVGLILGVALFKVWLAILVGLCFMTASLGMYGDQVLTKPLNTYFAEGLDREAQLVTLPAGDAAADAPAAITPQAELTSLWQHFSNNVPHFQVSVFAIAISTGLAGLIFGLLLPKLARSVWAASLGAGLTLVAVYALLQIYWPAGAVWMDRWWLVATIGTWLFSLVVNFVDMQEPRPKKPAEDEARPAPAPARSR